MVFRDEFETTKPTHKLVTRNLPDVKDWDEVGWISVENRALTVFMNYGAAVQFQLDPKHGQFETVQRELTRVLEPNRLFAGSEEEYRATLPNDRELVQSLLTVTTGDTDEPIDRAFYLDAFAVVTEQSWVYRSVPHHFHVREINATGHAGLLEELRESLADVRGSTVVPFEGLISWEADSTQYELVWDALRQSDGGEGYVSYDLERLKHAAMHPQEHSLVFEWESASGEPLLRRAFWRFFDPETATPPRRIVVPDRLRRREVLSAFRRLRRDLDYQYTVEADSTE